MKRYLPGAFLGAGLVAVTVGQIADWPTRIPGALLAVLGALAWLANQVNRRLDHMQQIEEQHYEELAGDLEWNRLQREVESARHTAKPSDVTPSPGRRDSHGRHREPRPPRQVRHLTVHDGLKGLVLAPVGALAGWAVARARENVTTTAAAMAVALPVAGALEHGMPDEGGTGGSVTVIRPEDSERPASEPQPVELDGSVADDVEPVSDEVSEPTATPEPAPTTAAPTPARSEPADPEQTEIASPATSATTQAPDSPTPTPSATVEPTAPPTRQGRPEDGDGDEPMGPPDERGRSDEPGEHGNEGPDEDGSEKEKDSDDADAEAATTTTVGTMSTLMEGTVTAGGATLTLVTCWVVPCISQHERSQAWHVTSDMEITPDDRDPWQRRDGDESGKRSRQPDASADGRSGSSPSGPASPPKRSADSSGPPAPSTTPRP